MPKPSPDQVGSTTSLSVLQELVNQIDRLGETRGAPKNCSVADLPEALRDELDEFELELTSNFDHVPVSEGVMQESADCLAVAVHLVRRVWGNPELAMIAATVKLKTRLDLVEREGTTWEEAKTREPKREEIGHHHKVERLERMLTRARQRAAFLELRLEQLGVAPSTEFHTRVHLIRRPGSGGGGE